jgi:hypothetical protein
MEADDCRVLLHLQAFFSFPSHRKDGSAAHAIAIAAAETETGRKRYFAHSLNEKP